MGDYAARQAELTSYLRDLGRLADEVEVDVAHIDVLCSQVLRLTESAHVIAAGIVSEAAGGSP